MTIKWLVSHKANSHTNLFHVSLLIKRKFVHYENLYLQRNLTLSTWQTKTNTCANSVDIDEAEPSPQDLHRFQFCFWV